MKRFLDNLPLHRMKMLLGGKPEQRAGSADCASGFACRFEHADDLAYLLIAMFGT
jgi:hypothetical protein